MTEEQGQADAVAAGVRRLERELVVTRRQSSRALKGLHARMSADLKAAEKRAKQAEKRAAAATAELDEARRRARRAEAELAEVRGSATWKVGRAVVAVPARLRGRRRS